MRTNGTDTLSETDGGSRDARARDIEDVVSLERTRKPLEESPRDATELVAERAVTEEDLTKTPIEPSSCSINAATGDEAFIDAPKSYCLESVTFVLSAVTSRRAWRLKEPWDPNSGSASISWSSRRCAVVATVVTVQVPTSPVHAADLVAAVNASPTL